MDIPPGMFAEELLDYYPYAKVILSRRRDVDAWHRSLHKAMDAISGWSLWKIRFFDAELFWWYRTMVLWVSHISGGQDFKTHGKQWAKGYYERLEEKLRREGREYLDWEVGDGWGSLCEFLGEELPQEEFPWGNRGGDEFRRNAEKAMEKMAKRAMLKCSVVVGAVAVAVGYWIWDVGDIW